MFFKKKSTNLQPRIEKALKLAEQISKLASPYLHQKNYHPTPQEIERLKQLNEACYYAYAYTGNVVFSVQQEPKLHLHE